MEKFSVKKPFTVLVGVIMVLVLGWVSVTSITLDLLPEMSLPYMMVITTYPGASPEKVETTVTDPLENSLGTVTGVKNIYSTSYENFSLIQLEFESGTNMDSAMVKVSGAIQQLTGQLPEGASTPSILEISADMMASMYVAVSREGYDVYRLSEYINDDVMPYIKRQSGVASVSTIGLVEKSVQVDLDKDKIDELNNKILALTNESLAEAEEKLKDAEAEVQNGLAELEEAEETFGETVSDELFETLKEELDGTIEDLKVTVSDLADALEELQQETEDTDLNKEIKGIVADLRDLSFTLEVVDSAAGLLPTTTELNRLMNTINALMDILEANGAGASLEIIMEDIQLLVGAMTGAEALAAQLATELTALSDALAALDGALGDTGGTLTGFSSVEILAWRGVLGLSVTALEQGGSAALETVLDPTGVINLPGTLESIGVAMGTVVALNELETADVSVQLAFSSLSDAMTAVQGTLTMLGQLGSIDQAALQAELMTELSNLATALGAASAEATNRDLSRQITNILYKVEDAMNELSRLDSGSGSGSGDGGGLLGLADSLDEIADSLEELLEDDPNKTFHETIDSVNDAVHELDEALEDSDGLLRSVTDALGGLMQGQLDAAVGFSTAMVTLQLAEQQLDAAWEQFEDARETALESANLDQLLNVQTLSGLIYAQNFSMPAGYIDDADSESWLLRVGEEYGTVDAIAHTLLAEIDDIGEVRVEDVANVTVIDNAGKSYSRLNGESAVVLCIYKGSTAGTNDVSKACKEAFSEVSEREPGTQFVILSDQGDYINLIVESVLSSMGIGCLLAILILALFLKDYKPTLVVGISIPLSVLFAIVLMYFSNLTLNMITLSGLALGIGMLVDNSIVVLENIYRLRNRGVPAPRAAVQGTKQVAGSIIASTLTTICVFIPMLFSSGMVRELLIPMGLSITYCLAASLIVAMSVVPATASTLLKNTKPKEHPFFDRVIELYGRSVDWCLRHKVAPLSVAIVLLAFCVWQIVQMGIVVIPSFTADTVSVTISTPEEMERDDSYAVTDEAIRRILELDGVDTVGVMDAGSTLAMFTSLAGSSESYGSYICYVAPEGELGSKEVKALCRSIEEATADLDCKVSAESDSMSDLSALTAQGLSVAIYGPDLDTMAELSWDIVDLVDEIEGFKSASNGIEDEAETVHLEINRDEAMRLGLTVAQIYSEVAQRLVTSAASTTLTIDGVELSVEVQNLTDPLLLEALLDIEFETTSMDEDGAQVTETHKLSEIAEVTRVPGTGSVSRENQSRYMTVSAGVEDGYNTTLLSRELEDKLAALEAEGGIPAGYKVEIQGESSEVNDMVWQMAKMMVIAFIFIYLVMVAQFQSLLSPFIVLFTIPLAFTGGLLGLMVAGQQLSMLALMGFLVLMGTVVNNGIVFVDYTNLLRLGGMEKRDALIAAGKTRMRPILMTTLTTILGMTQLMFGDDMGSQLGSGMAIVISGGLAYATLMTLYIVPVMYDIFFRRKPHVVDVGSDTELDDIPDDAAEFLKSKGDQSPLDTSRQGRRLDNPRVEEEAREDEENLQPR